MAPRHKSITPKIEQGSGEFCAGFLRGFFDTDGSVQGTQSNGVSIRLSQTDLPRLQAVQRMLLRLGIASTIYTNRRRAGIRSFPDGKGGRKAYRTQSQHDLVVAGDNLPRFQEVIGFCDSTKAARLTALLGAYQRRLSRARFTASIEAVTADGTEDVFDVQIPTIHAFDANGFVCHNCGEQPLLAYESCTLGSINVARFVTRAHGHTAIDYDRLGTIIPLTVRFLDNVLDRTKFPLPSIAEQTLRTRKIGLGIMGFADLLIQLGIPYDTEEALQTADQLMEFIQSRSHAASARLADERGVFPAYRGSRLQAQRHRRRNATVTTIAPTGTISIIADCSAGIEPLYGISVARTVMEDIRLESLHPEFIRQARARRLPLATLRREVGRAESIQHVNRIPQDLRRLFVTAHDIDPAHHVRMQAVFQRHSDSGVSKTINLPPTARPEDVAKAFVLAHELGCKGLTVFRSGSRDHQVLACSHVQSC
jgi:ribonucleoside-diphosphate reductase alpha chain